MNDLCIAQLPVAVQHDTGPLSYQWLLNGEPMNLDGAVLSCHLLDLRNEEMREAQGEIVATDAENGWFEWRYHEADRVPGRYWLQFTADRPYDERWVSPLLEWRVERSITDVANWTMLDPSVWTWESTVGLALDMTMQIESVWTWHAEADLQVDMVVLEIESGWDTDSSVYLNDPEATVGDLRVLINPSEIRPYARWTINSTEYEHNQVVELNPGEYTVSFKKLGGWQEPDDAVANVTAGELTTISGSYTEQIWFIEQNEDYPFLGVELMHGWRD